MFYNRLLFMQADVIIIGAGAAGLMAAKELSEKKKKVLVLEARERIGGRIHTIKDSFLQPVEAGAEFIHGNLKLTLQLLKASGIKFQKSGGEFLRSRNGSFTQDELFDDYDELIRQLKKLTTDVSVGTFLDTYFKEEKHNSLRSSIKSYVEGYYAAELYMASALALKEELESSDNEQYRVEGGYGRLVNHLYEQCQKNGCVVKLSTVVKSITWSKGAVQMRAADEQLFTAEKGLITVPLGVLQSKPESTGHISFHPLLHDKMEAANRLGFGPVIKVLMQFNEPFWQRKEELKKAGFIFSKEEIPTWWTQYPKPSSLLVGWCAGPKADGLKSDSDEQILQKSIYSLAAVFGITLKEVQERLIKGSICNWAADAFAEGGYTYTTVDTPNAIKVMTDPVEDTLFFAGEALCNSKDVGTVEAALQSGWEVSKKILKDK
jgi:monoamine oxidase